MHLATQGPGDPQTWGAFAGHPHDPRVDQLDDEPYTEADAIWDATGELFANVDGCAATLHNAMPDAAVHHVTVDGDWLSDEADMAQCLACLLQSDDDEHIATAAYRLRTLLAESKDGAEFVAARAKELLAAEGPKYEGEPS